MILPKRKKIWIWMMRNPLKKRMWRKRTMKRMIDWKLFDRRHHRFDHDHHHHHDLDRFHRSLSTWSLHLLHDRDHDRHHGHHHDPKQDFLTFHGDFLTHRLDHLDPEGLTNMKVFVTLIMSEGTK